MKVLIIGGVAGGATAAARLRRLDESGWTNPPKSLCLNGGIIFLLQTAGFPIT